MMWPLSKLLPVHQWLSQGGPTYSHNAARSSRTGMPSSISHMAAHLPDVPSVNSCIELYRPSLAMGATALTMLSALTLICLAPFT